MTRRHGRRLLTTMMAMAIATLPALSGPPTGAATGQVVLGPASGKTVVGTRIVYGGHTLPIKPGARVAVERRVEGGRWSTRGFGTTDKHGYWHIAVTPSSVGIYALRIRTTVGYSQVFYLRVLPSIVLDQGGMQGLRLGMTLDQAKATHWLETVTTACDGSQFGDFHPTPVDGPYQAPWVEAVFDGQTHRLRSIFIGRGRTRDGLHIGDPTATVARVYRAPTYRVQVDIWSATSQTHTVTQAGRTVYTVTIYDGSVVGVAAPALGPGCV